MPGPLFATDFLAGYDLVLTPNLRSARQLEAQALGPNAGAHVAEILPWRAWTSSLWHGLILSGAEDRVLLNEAQTALLWEEAIQQHSPSTLRPVRSIVDLSMQAHTLLARFGASARLRQHATEQESDARAFATWLQELEHLCARKRCVAPAMLESELARATAAGASAAFPGMRLLLYGFDRLYPNQQELLEQAERTGAMVDYRDACCDPQSGYPPPSAPLLLRCETGQGALDHLARSLRDRLEAGASGISVIVPNLAGERGSIERALRAALAAGPGSAASLPLWEFSEGKPLTAVPMSRDALMLLDWLAAPQLPENIGHLLRSPYLHFQISPEDAAELDAASLRDGKRIRPEWTLLALAHAVRSGYPGLHGSLMRLHGLADVAARKPRNFASWVDLSRSALETAGWPGERERTSVEFQTVDRWNDLLDETEALDVVADRAMPYEEFLRVLRHQTGTTLFSPENTGAPIQIMTPQESAGTTAQELWMLNADENKWNSRRSLHPLLPFGLQKEFGMPGTDAAADADEARRMTERLVNSASDVRFLFAEADEDGPVRPSPLVTHLSGLQQERVKADAHQPTSLQLTTLLDDDPLPPLPPERTGGGVSILQSQAACAFRAFAERRLFASEPDAVDLGLGPRERGNALHTALEKFWSGVRNQAELHRLIRENRLDAELRRVVGEALPQHAGMDSWTHAYLDLQRERLLVLLHRWMEYEAERPPFQVLHTEQEVEAAEVGPLHLRMRVDRVDQVQLGGETATVLIDYKTGEPDTKGWMGDRPGEPQLPTYAVAAGLENVQAIAFAVVKPGEKNLRLKTFPDRTPLLFRNTKPADELQFEEELEKWWSTLNALATDFASGVADVGPKEYPGTCRFCAQRMLCRLNPETLQELSDDEEGAELAP